MVTEPRTDGVIWRPRSAEIERTRLHRFLRRHGLADYDALVRRTAADPAWFWEAAVADLQWEWLRPYDEVLDLSAGAAWPRWFVGARCNLVHNAVDRHARARPHDVALVGESEDGAVRELTFAALAGEVAKLSLGLRELGVGPGERVGLYLPMIPEAAIALLACAKIGAIAVPLFSGFGPKAVAARLADAGARVLLTVDAFRRRGAAVPAKAVAEEAAALLPGLEHIVVLRWTGVAVPWREGRDHWWHELVAGRPSEAPTEALAPDEPFLLAYTSGTTGRPKAAVHTHGGFPIQCTSDLAYCFDLGPEDRLFWVTDMGWVMGPLEIIAGLTLGASVLLYEGAPDHPAPDRLWSLIARHRVTVLGLSPTAVRAAMTHGSSWVRKHDLGSLRVLGSTGEAWNEDAFRWFFDEVGGGRRPVLNYSGGTEIGGGILCGNLITPIKPCGFAGPAPGMVAEVWSEDGLPVRQAVGELVVRGPWPGMTNGFWQDPQRYLESYWQRWPGVWVHGDWAEIDADGHWFIRGRSDDTMKVAGKRIGPAEIESAALGHADVAEAAAIGLPDGMKGEAIACFAVLRPGAAASAVLAEEIRDEVGRRLGKALRPDSVKFLSQLPKTRSAKVMRRVLRARYLGLDAGDLSTLDNADVLLEIDRVR